MGRLDDAIARLDGAVDGIETGVAAALGPDGRSGALAAELAAARRENAALSAAAAEADAGLDRAIGRLKSVLEG